MCPKHNKQSFGKLFRQKIEQGKLFLHLVLNLNNIKQTQYTQKIPSVCERTVLTSGLQLSFPTIPFHTWPGAGTSQALWGRGPVRQRQRQRNQQLHSGGHCRDERRSISLPVPPALTPEQRTGERRNLRVLSHLRTLRPMTIPSTVLSYSQKTP